MIELVIKLTISIPFLVNFGPGGHEVGIVFSGYTCFLLSYSESLLKLIYDLSEFWQRGAFPMDPTQSGLIFLPLTFELSISSQLQEVDAILHKATDEIISIELSNSSGFSNRITYTNDMQLLKR